MVINPEEQRIHLLIVDDEPLMVKLLKKALQKTNPHFMIDTATNGHAALNLVHQGFYDLALLDYRMPGMDGLTLARQIRDASPRTQLVLMSAYGSQAIAEARQKMPLDGYFTKPVSLHTLRDTVAGLLATPPPAYPAGA